MLLHFFYQIASCIHRMHNQFVSAEKCDNFVDEMLRMTAFLQDSPKFDNGF